jgi:gamma-glutamyltranspeptidase / glutathione hydrolase
LNLELKSMTTRKQPVIASQAVVSANHPMAAAAGLQMFAAGGTVADAAVATVFAAAVVEPMMLGIFGAGYILVRNGQTGEFWVIDNYSPAPSAATPEMYLADNASGTVDPRRRKNRVGYLACAVPGSLDGWCLLHSRLGRLPLAFVLGPAIAYAEHGFPVGQHLLQCIESEKDNLALFPQSAEIFLPRGKLPKVGDRIRNPDHAETLRLIAKDGPDVFYQGSLGDRVVDEIQSHGGLLTKKDLQSYSVIECEPIRGTYRDCEIVGVPLTSAGGILIQEALNILEGFDLKALGFGTARYWHLILEVLKIVFADRNRYLGDPRFVESPIKKLLDKNYAAARRSEIDLQRAAILSADISHTADSSHTTHITVMDAAGNMVLMTQTLMEFFGCRAMIPGTGAFMNNTMALFDPHPGRPNSIAPGKRMLTFTSSTIVRRDGKPWFALGTPGGERIFSSVLQAILNLIDHGMTLQEAVEAPRVFANGRVTEVESDIGSKILDELKSLGHKANTVFNIAGGMNGVEVLESGLLRGAACWRADGAPAGLSGGPARPGNYSA